MLWSVFILLIFRGTFLAWGVGGGAGGLKIGFSTCVPRVKIKHYHYVGLGNGAGWKTFSGDFLRPGESGLISLKYYKFLLANILGTGYLDS